MAAPITVGRDVTDTRATGASRAAGWGAVFALTLCVATLIASEFMPVSLLTPIATDLRITEGRAGQAIAVSGVFAVLTSLGISRRDARDRPPSRAAGADGADGRVGA